MMFDRCVSSPPWVIPFSIPMARFLCIVPRKPAQLLVALVAAGLLTGCASSRPQVSVEAAPIADAAEAERLLRDAVDAWYGTPYVYGGSSSRGVDCSAFVQLLYRDVLGVSVPRTTDDQSRAGRTVPLDEAETGDLVFFRPSRKQNHVGLYLGDGEFAHASTSQGVMVSSLGESYWQQVYWMTRRLLPDGRFPPQTTSPGVPAPSPPRAGW